MNTYMYRILILADCTWDYFTCTKRYGTWPFNKRCCNKRFDMCCKMMMKNKNKRPLHQIPMKTTTSTTITTTTSTELSSPIPTQSAINNPDKIQLSKYNVLE